MNKFEIKDRKLIVKQDVPPKKITGTKIGSILGKNPYESPISLWLAMTHTYEEPTVTTKYMNAGVVIEPKQKDYIKQCVNKNILSPADIYGDDYLTTTKKNFFNNEIFGGMWDYIAKDGDTINTVFEMKTTNISKLPDWEIDIPEYYALQAALYGYLLGVDLIQVAVSFLNDDDYITPENYIPSKDNTFIKEFKISERYNNFEEEYIKPLINWYNQYIITGISPEIKDSEVRIVKTAYDKVMGNDKILESLHPNKRIGRIFVEHNDVVYRIFPEELEFYSQFGFKKR